MSKQSGFFSSLDELITRSLGQFCWWAEAKFNENNVSLARKVVQFAVITICLLMVWKQIEEFTNSDEAGFSVLIFYVICLIFFAMIYSVCGGIWNIVMRYIFRGVLDGAREIPNKNKYKSAMSSFKAITLGSLPVIPLMQNENEFALTLFYFSVWLSAYLLCTEVKPPVVEDVVNEGS